MSPENATGNFTDPILEPAVQSFFYVIYTVIFVVGLSGNLLTCYVVFRNKDMQTVTNYFITNLALSDILLCVLSVPFTPLYTFRGSWIFGTLMCHLVTFVQATSVYVSTLTLTSIAIDRYFVILYPFRPRMKVTKCLAIIYLIWLFSVCAILPYGYFMSAKKSGYCEEEWPTSASRKAYGAVTLTLQFIIPFIIIAFCYIKISHRLNDRTKARPGSHNPHREEIDRVRKQRTNRMLIAMVFIFGLCWLPFNCVNVLNDFSESISNTKYYNICFFTVHVIAMSSTCYNPFLYAWLNENFRKEFKQVLPGFTRHSSNVAYSTETVQESLPSMSVRRLSSVRRLDIEPTVRCHLGDEEVDISNVGVIDLKRKNSKKTHVGNHL